LVEQDDVLVAFQNQVDSYRMGFVRAISTQDVRNIAITQRTPRPEQLWDRTMALHSSNILTL
jgi:hypothetical protein